MTQAFSEGNFSYPENILPQNTTEPTTSEVILRGEDTHLSLFEQQALEFASRESANFVDIDKQVDSFIGLLGKDLSSIQSATTDPNILVRQADHVMNAAGQIIDGSVADKIAIRQRNQQNLQQEISRGEDNKDLMISAEVRRQRIVEVLLANRGSREGILETQVGKLETAISNQMESIESYRQFLEKTDPAQLMAFEAHFPTLSMVEPILTHPSEKTMTRTEELEAMVNSVVIEVAAVQRPRTGQTLLIMAGKAIQVTIVKPFKVVRGLLEISGETMTPDEQETDFQKVA